jgi:hypothetical protein
MSEKKVLLILSHMAEKIAPGDEIHLWPGLQARFQASASNQNRGIQMNTRKTLSSRLQVAAFFTATLVLVAALFLAVPQGRAWAQSVLHFFTRAESDSLSVQPFQLTPIPATSTPDPGDINHATLSIDEVEQKAGYHVLKPANLSEHLSLVGATFDPGNRAVRIFYRFVETNGLVLREEPFQTADDCELCGKVGASAAVEVVKIGSAFGEYAEGVWQLTDQGPQWVSDPYLKTIRWQAGGMAFELLFMGPPDSLTKADMVRIAESIK